ncbi:hypothetical protein H206_02870 [Candidatus Electrothrix aarhusensis]|jgi:hypothetical protein|uniref:Uncharacterized protein n=1 Tax=Candidatus Electrothrix aarhusensis TaxID=1859131 RepID=A0A3S3R3G8_9BACT|nr:hypothetical protein H206_02870 [Candidatus Electrothrix aarhusensis]
MPEWLENKLVRPREFHRFDKNALTGKIIGEYFSLRTSGPKPDDQRDKRK